MHSRYGADVTRKQYIALTAASAIGTVLEWYDYSVWTQLSPFLSKAFFPAKESLVLQQLNFWLVYAVGFLFRPLGSLFFGHLCDVVGRRVSLLATLIMMGTATVLIGCLPTYAHIGIAAPVLLAVLRLLQGLAVGGELGTAVVFMHELAPASAKTKGGCVVFMSVNAGIVFGILVAMIVNAAVPAEYMLIWGWRIPFLLAALTATAGVVLRWDMPEPYEFINGKTQLQQQQPLKQQQQQQQQQTPGKILSTGNTRESSTAAAAAAGAADAEPSDHLLQADGKLIVNEEPSTSGKGSDNTSVQQQHQQQQCHVSCSSSKRRSWLGHRPISMLFREHWREVLLMFWFETWSAANFYVFYGWLPSFLNTQLGIPLKLTLGMTLTNMSLTLSMIPLFAHLSDKGAPRMAATACILTVAAAASIPMFLAISTRSFAAAWLMQLADLTLNASVFGFIPTIGNNLFPVHVRATGFNFVHTASQSWLGGLSPLIITALQLATGNSLYVTGIYLTAAAVISLSACAAMWRWYPATNKTPPAMQQAAQQLLPAAATQ